jgi:hypothetical protein
MMCFSYADQSVMQTSMHTMKFRVKGKKSLPVMPAKAHPRGRRKPASSQWLCLDSGGRGNDGHVH